MIIDAARAAAGHLLTPAFRGVLLKSIGLTLLLLAALWVGIAGLFDMLALPRLDAMLPDLPAWFGWLGVLAAVVAGLALAIGLGLLIAPATALVAGLFLDDVAEIVERTDFPNDPPGRALPLLRSLWLALKFFAVVVLANLAALVTLLIPGVNVAAFFLVNGYLLGREFFEFAAMRHLPEERARALRQQNAGTVFLAGLVIAAFLAVPVLNLATPLFAAAMMLHLFKRIASSDRR